MVQALGARLDRCRRWSPLVADTALAAVVGVVTVIGVLVEASNSDERLSAYGAVLLVGQIVPLVWRRRAPVGVAIVVLLCAMAYGMAELPDPPATFAPLLAIYTMAANRPRRVAVPFALVAIAGATVALLFGDNTDPSDVATSYFSGTVAWVVGDTTRGQRERAGWLEDRRADAAHQAARDERVRIARDLHDVVAHHVSVIAVQAEAAQEILATRPDRASAAMGHVADTARTALGELRRVLGVLRSDATLAPQPGLAAIDELVASVRATGLPVTLSHPPANPPPLPTPTHTAGTTETAGGAGGEVAGNVGDGDVVEQVGGGGGTEEVDAVVGLTAYRVVQEALTNVLKHAGPCEATVCLEHTASALVVTVADTGRGVDGRASAPGATSGQGLVGMRERVAVLGGRFEAGPGPHRDGNGAGGGFLVRATLPLEPRR